MRLVRVEQVWPRHVWLDATSQWGGASTHPGILTARGCDLRGHWWGWVISAHAYAGGDSVGVTEGSGWHRAEHIRIAEAVRPDG